MKNNDPIIRIENISKVYRRGSTAINRSLIDSLRDTVRNPLGAINARTHLQEEFYALFDVSFNIYSGDVVGIIGSNGSGKSTLLKIISGITFPDKGKISLQGRVGSLLEVGTGFHPAMTGRENIYFNGLVLGMRKKEIDEKFDEIVKFSGVEKFLDTPVKRYSSGMTVRLGFAVAAHLEPEILVVDEVLSVGDASFQKKCLGKMQEVSEGGRTILFVSHNIGMINQLCSRCIWLDYGTVKMNDSTLPVISAYNSSNYKSSDTNEITFIEDKNKSVQLRRASLHNINENPTSFFSCDEDFFLDLLLQVHNTTPNLYGYLQISKEDGTIVLASDSADLTNAIDFLPLGYHKIRVTIPSRSLGPGRYSIYISFGSTFSKNFLVDCPGTICTFELDDYLSKRGNNRLGFFSTILSWRII